MIRGVESVTIFSENAANLAKFYKDKVGLKATTEAEMGENGDEFYEFKLAEGSPLYVIDHSEVKGKSKEPKRVMINLEVDDIEKEAEKLDKAGVKKIQDIYHVQGYGMIATFEDVDGNFFQLAQVRAN
ncbi:VOC family protein [Patescibacteria group bacterium]|nr:VOC family protein [Patescibacteria group bacterium]